MSGIVHHQAAMSREEKVTLLAKLLREKAGQIERLPTSYAQRGLWFLDQLEPGRPVYNMQSGIRLTGVLHLPTLERSLDAIIRRHESLRTTFASDNGQPIQVIAPRLDVPVERHDLEHLPAGQREAEAQRLTGNMAQLAFDLERGPLIRLALLRLAEEEHVLLLTLHHIVSDGWSMGILFRELATLYDAFSRGKPSPLPELSCQYADHALWQREWLQGAVLEEQLAYWSAHRNWWQRCSAF